MISKNVDKFQHFIEQLFFNSQKIIKYCLMAIKPVFRIFAIHSVWGINQNNFQISGGSRVLVEIRGSTMTRKSCWSHMVTRWQFEEIMIVWKKNEVVDAENYKFSWLWDYHHNEQRCFHQAMGDMNKKRGVVRARLQGTGKNQKGSKLLNSSLLSRFDLYCCFFYRIIGRSTLCVWMNAFKFHLCK